MNKINHTVFSDEKYELTHASASLGEQLIGDGRSVDFALRLSSAAARVLEYDTTIRKQRHHHNVQGRIFNAPGEVIRTGIRRLLGDDIEEPFGLELGHIINLGPGGGEPPYGAEARLCENLDAAIKNSTESVVISEPQNPKQSFRTIRHAEDNMTLVVGAIRTPILDIQKDNTRVEVHTRSSYGLYTEGRPLELEHARQILEEYERNGIHESMFSEVSRAKDSIYVFPATTTLVGLRRSRSEVKNV